MKDWQRQVLRFAAQHPDESKAAYCRWVEPKPIHVDTLRKAFLRDPEFREAFERARKGQASGADAVSVEQFIRDPDFLGAGIRYVDEKGTVLPIVAREVQQIVEGNYSVALLTGSLGSGKTFTASYVIVRLTYELLLEENPHERLGLDPNTIIVIYIQSQTQKKAKSNDYNLVRNLIIGSKWFQLNAQIDDRVKWKIVFLGRNIEIRPAGPSPEELIGENCYMALLDEANFWARVRNSSRAVYGRDYDEVRQNFESVLRRRQSRFDSGVAGPILVASSKRFAGDFTDQILKEFGDSDGLYVYDHTMWSVHPQRFEGKPWFRMYTGNRHQPPRILSDDDILDPEEERHVIEIPKEFERSFRRDPVGSLMEIAGHSAQVYGGFFTDMERLNKAASLDQCLCRSFDVTRDATLLLPEAHTFVIENPESPRHVHVDLALTTDNAGLAIGHIAKFDNRGLPVIHVDAVARIRPPQVGQIDIDSFYRIVEAWKSGGIPIHSFSADGYQSSDLLQRLRRLNLRAGRISADQTEPNNPMGAYECLRAAVGEGRFFFPEDEETVDDMKLLQIDYKASRGLGKVDHLPGKKKDTSDCLASLAWHLTHNMRAFELVGKVDGAGYAAAVAAPQLGSTVTNVPAPKLTAMDEIRLLRGMPLR